MADKQQNQFKLRSSATTLLQFPDKRIQHQRAEYERAVERIAQTEATGFRLDKKSEINVNPKDTKDAPEGVWPLPRTLSDNAAVYQAEEVNHHGDAHVQYELK